MGVLAVTWMAKVGHEADVIAVFAKLTEESRKEPGCSVFSSPPAQDRVAALFSSTSSTETMPRWKLIAPRPIFCNSPGRICPRLQIARKGISSNRWASPCRAGALARLRTPVWIISCRYQFAAARVAFLRHFIESHDDPLTAGTGFFDESIGDTLGDLAFFGRRCVPWSNGD